MKSGTYSGMFRGVEYIYAMKDHTINKEWFNVRLEMKMSCLQFFVVCVLPIRADRVTFQLQKFFDLRTKCKG